MNHLRNANAPGGRTEGGRSDHHGEGSLTSLPSTNDRHADDDPAAAFRECFAVLVRGKSIRRHLYFNLPAAERAVKRALTRGDRADLVLVKLVPVDGRRLHLEDHGTGVTA